MFPLSVWILIVVAILAYIYSRPKQQINLPGKSITLNGI